MKCDRKEAKLEQTFPTYEASEWVTGHKKDLIFLCLLHWFHLFVRTLSFPSEGLRSWPLTPSKGLLLSCHSSLIGLWNQPCSRRDAGLPTCARRVLLSFRVLLIICWVVSRWVSSWPNCMATRGADRWRKDQSEHRGAELAASSLLRSEPLTETTAIRKGDKMLSFLKFLLCFHLCRRIKREIKPSRGRVWRIGAGSLNDKRLVGAPRTSYQCNLLSCVK